MERDNGLEDPYGCRDPFTGETVHRGTAIVVPVGMPMPPGSVPPDYHGVGPPTTSIYMCQDGHWVGVVTYHEKAIELLSDAISVTATQGSAAQVSGSYTYAGDAAVALSASVGSVDDDGNGAWTWQHTPDGESGDGQVVVITATADDQTTRLAFELRHDHG